MLLPTQQTLICLMTAIFMIDTANMQRRTRLSTKKNWERKRQDKKAQVHDNASYGVHIL